MLLVAALYKAGDAIRVLQKGNTISLTEKEFKKCLAKKGGKIYNRYCILAWDYCLHLLPKEPADQEAMHCLWLAQQRESIDKTLQMLVSNMWGGREKQLARDSEMHGEVRFSVNLFRPADIWAGPSQVNIWV